MSPSTSPPTDRTTLRRNMLVAVAALTAYTLATVAVPRLQFTVFSADLRIVIETVGLSVALFTALALMLPGDGDAGVARDAFVAALVALGVSGAVFGVGPVLLDEETAGGGPVSFYAWLLARYAAGLLFIAATVGRPRLGVRRYVLVTLVVLALVDTVVAFAGDALPLPLEELDDLRGGMSVRLASLWDVLVIAAAPGALFAVGATLAWRVFARTSSPLYMWLSLGLWTQVAAQAHEVLYPAVLGPTITSADLLRSLVLLMLLLGALLKVQALWSERQAAMRVQEKDLQIHRELLDASRTFTDQEEAFRSLVVHELATPIAAVRAYVHVVTDQVEGTGPVRRALDGLHTESARLQALVARMEELRAVDDDEFDLQPQPVLLRTLLDEVVRYVHALPGHHRARVTCDGVRVMVDPLRLGQALRNMVTNAVAYTPDGTTVSLEGHRTGDGRVRIAVVDEGPGIPTAERRRLMEKYQRGSTSGGSHGMGLGLYLARRIAEAHGGRLRIDDGDGGRGTRVVIEVGEA